MDETLADESRSFPVILAAKKEASLSNVAQSTVALLVPLDTKQENRKTGKKRERTGHKQTMRRVGYTRRESLKDTPPTTSLQHPRMLLEALGIRPPIKDTISNGS